MKSLPPKSFEMFLNVFSKIPQRVVWKWEDQPLENLPPNILMVDWLPQIDLLGILVLILLKTNTNVSSKTNS